MEKETFQRAIAISKRLKELEEVLKDISPNSSYRLSYVNSDNKGCREWEMRYISEFLDKHDEMIRAEIQQEIDALNAEIETL